MRWSPVGIDRSRGHKAGLGCGLRPVAIEPIKRQKIAEGNFISHDLIRRGHLGDVIRTLGQIGDGMTDGEPLSAAIRLAASANKGPGKPVVAG